MNNKISKQTYTRLTLQLQNLQKEMMDVVLPELEKAREFSNSEENDDMMHARLMQSNYENRISDLDRLIRDSEVVEEIKFTGRVIYGTEVHIQNSDTGLTRWVRIVGEMEGRANNEVSFKSPFAQAFIGHIAGDEVEVQAPGGTQNWEILEVKVSNVFSRTQNSDTARAL